MKIIDAEFVKSAVEPETWPPAERPEVAFVGRSNVGKSSMLNRLSGRKALARVSNTPGRTRLLNFFDLTIERGASREILRICDLPGYGFAKVSKAERANWSQMIGAYLEEREALKAVVVIIDVRIGPTDDDLEMLRWLDAEGRRSIVVATKLDKLPKAKRSGRLRQIEAQLQMIPRSLLGFSSEEGLGRDELLARVIEAAHAE